MGLTRQTSFWRSGVSGCLHQGIDGGADRVAVLLGELEVAARARVGVPAAAQRDQHYGPRMIALKVFPRIAGPVAADMVGPVGQRGAVTGVAHQDARTFPDLSRATSTGRSWSAGPPLVRRLAAKPALVWPQASVAGWRSLTAASATCSSLSVSSRV